ncbi:hypothetical protein DBR17_04485 [Sphingomonas sp. HMWF008]|nr:hypothetical protein DBR17_04485 [Sphingomonas sp. HMWF008]
MSAVQSAHPGARGRAGSASDAKSDPLAAISQPILLETSDESYHPVAWKEALRGHRSGLEPYARLMRTKRAFAVGGLSLIIDCGLVVDWYNADATRRDALDLIEQRGFRPLLNELSDKDSSSSIFGKNDLRDFFKTFPPVDRETRRQASSPTSPRAIRLEHPLRLRKAFEFLFLTEAVLRFRFRIGETKLRFEQATGMTANSEDDASKIWGFMWVEPLLYTLEPLPREADINRIMQSERPLRFSQVSGQRESALFWAMRGVPGTYLTARAAAEICDSFYGKEAAPTVPVTIDPTLFDARLSLLSASPSASGGAMSPENIVQLRAR